MAPPVDPKLLRMLENASLPLADEAKLVKSLEGRDPATLAEACRVLARERRRLLKELVEAQARHALVEEMARRLNDAPWHPALVLRPAPDARVEVLAGGRRQVVATAPGVEPDSLEPGHEVFLDAEQKAVVARSEATERIGLVGTVADVEGETAAVSGAGAEEVRALCAPGLAATLQPGDRVLYTRDYPYVLARLPERQACRWILESPRAVPFERVRGLDAVVREIRGDLDLHLLHPETVATYRLSVMRGILLVGPPGCGKTLLAAAIAYHLASTRPDTRFLHVPPGAVRGSYYGETEARIRDIFAVARGAPGLVVLFLDEIDSFGMRGTGAGHDIDGRVLGTLLSELDGLERCDNVLAVGATNRLDLCDEALVRKGRFGDRIHHVPRPGREATREILASTLTPDLPYAEGPGEETAATYRDAAASYLHAPEGGAGPVATVTFSDSERREIRPAAVLSGALLCGAVEHAKHVAARRHLLGGQGLVLEDLLDALDAALTAEAHKLAKPQAARRVLDIENADQIALVELPEARRVRRHRYLRAAA